MIKKLFLVLSFCICHLILLAASDSIRYQISFAPQYLINNGFKIGFDVRLSNHNWLSISPEFYEAYSNDASAYGANSYIENNNFYYVTNKYEPTGDSLRGLGLYIEDKVFFGAQNQYSGFYFKYGLGYTKYYIDFDDLAWLTYQKNGNTYTGLKEINGYLDIDKFEITTGVGYALKFLDVLRADFVLGWGNNFTNTKTNLEGARNYNRSTYDYGYNGGHLILTVQLGYTF